jgi:broad specificity phosphatase PhoE
MTTLYLVRHAKPAAAWGETADAGLDETGHTQARRAAEELVALGRKLPILSSPLKRCRETAKPLAALWNSEVEIFSPVAEIPSPPLSGAAKQQWLASGMLGDWSQLQASAPVGSPDYSAWRNDMLAALRALPGDAVIFSHYIAINVILGAAQNSERVIVFRPGHASITRVEVTPDALRVIKLGREAEAGSSVLLGK